MSRTAMIINLQETSMSDSDADSLDSESSSSYFAVNKDHHARPPSDRRVDIVLPAPVLVPFGTETRRPNYISSTQLVVANVDTDHPDPFSPAPVSPPTRSLYSPPSLASPSTPSFVVHSRNPFAKSKQQQQQQQQQPLHLFSTSRSSSQRPTSSTKSSLIALLSPKRLTPSRSSSSRPASTASTSSISTSNFATDSSTTHTGAVSKSSSDSTVQEMSIEEETCPVCLEALSLRLEGEKQHVIPICGHRLHHACFVAVYGGGPVKTRGTTSLGLCGVCRKDMKLAQEGNGSGNGRNKFAAMAGLPSSDHTEGRLPRSSSRLGLYANEDEISHDPLDDDDLVVLHVSSTFPSTGSGSIRSTSTRSSLLPASPSLTAGSVPDTAAAVVRPIISVRSEHTTVVRSRTESTKKNLTCMVTISMPSRWPNAAMVESTTNRAGEYRDEGYEGSPRTTFSSSTGSSPRSPRTQQKSIKHQLGSPSLSSEEAFYHSPPSISGISFDRPPLPSTASNPFLSVVEDLQHRMTDWKGHSLDEFGALKLYDYINVRKERNVREFLVYLFEEAILCVADDKRKGFGKLVDGISRSGDKLRLKGRIYIRHVRSIVDSSQGSDLSLTVRMQDDAVEEFVMSFKSRASLEVWKSQIEGLLAARRISPLASLPSMYSGRFSDRSGLSTRSAAHTSMHSSYSRATSSSIRPSSNIIREENSLDLDQFNNQAQSPTSISSSFSQQQHHPQLSSPHSRPPSVSPIGVRDFMPLDLMLILSIGSRSSLKLGIIKSTLDFIVQTVGPRARISIVTYITGEGQRGVLRKTPFLAIGRAESRRKLEMMIDHLGSEASSVGAMVRHKEDSVNVATAVNLALDIVLQRKAKSALTGMILMNDGTVRAQKQQMDLVMTRAEAANTPIHTVGWGCSHDPSSLWLLSNHTKGTYTFVREYYELREIIGGIVGGILSIAATNVRLHISVPERRYFKIRKVAGTSNAIVASDGKDVDIDVGELRYGEKKDLIVEVEMEVEAPAESERQPTFSSATDEYFMKVGLDPLALGDASSFYDGEHETLSTDTPLFEVNVAYRDPAAGRNVSRLSTTSSLLTINVVTAPPPSASSSLSSPTSPPASDPAIVRRRMELLTSDMLTRTLLLMSRQSHTQAARLLVETKRIISTIAASLAARLATASTNTGSGSDTTPLVLAHDMLVACGEDVAHVLEGVTTKRSEFDSSYRNYAAQAAIVLREQRSWSAKTKTERLLWSADQSMWFARRSFDWITCR